MTAKHVETRDPFLLAASLADLSPAAMAALSADEAEAVVIACERVMAAVQARQSLAVDTLASRVEEDLAREEQSRPSPRGFSGPDVHGLVASMLAPALHCSTRTVQRRLLSDRWLVRTLDSTLAAHWDGDFERHRAEILVEAAHNVDPDLVQQFEAHVLESSLDPVTGEFVAVSERVRRMSRAQLSRRAGKIARELDPGSHAEAVRRAREERAVIVQPDRHRPGMARWLAFLPSDVSQRVFAAVDGLASQYARANAGTPIDAHRADALADLVLGSAEVKTVIELVVPVLSGRPTSTTSAFGELNPVTAAIVAPLTPAAPIDTSAPAASSATPTEATVPPDADEGATGGSPVRWFLPGCIDDPRHGTLVPNAIADLLSLPETQVRLARLDPDGSIAQDPNRYRPNRALRRRIKSRDGGCRFPGCHASTTDVDHVIVFPVGRTVFSNLICLCRTHHLFKHHGGWSPVLARDGTVTWTAPDGRVWVTEPRPHQIREDLHLTNGVDANVMHDLRQGWFPGLPRGLDIEQLCVIERRLPDEPPEPLHTPEAPSDWEALDSREGIEGIPPACSPLERQLARELALAA